MSEAIRCMWMRGGTSKGGYFLAEDLPADTATRDQLLLSIMGSPDPVQIDGLGGADPLTSKVAVVKPSTRPDADVDYLFLQVFVDQPVVTDAQNCGNILSGVGPFAIERGLVRVEGDETDVRIFMENTGQLATVRVQTPGGRVAYAGAAAVDGVPGTAAPVFITFADTAGASCGALLPTGNPRDEVQGKTVTCIDNGMPVVLLRATDFGLTGNEDRATLESNRRLRDELESIRLALGERMNLGDVSQKSVPKMCLLSAPTGADGTVNTRTFIPHRCHASIGVLGAVSVATACAIKGSVASDLARLPADPEAPLQIEHPSGQMAVVLRHDQSGRVAEAAIVRTARKLFDGDVFSH